VPRLLAQQGPDHGRACFDAGADRNTIGEPSSNSAESSPERTFGVILVCFGRTEQGYQATTREQRDRATKGLHVAHHLGERATDQLSQVFGAEPGTLTGWPGQFGEKHAE
jgi:hypothetical protein